MKEYTNPPLLYVKSELWWHLRTKEEADKCTLLSGILHPQLSKLLPKITSLNNKQFNGISYLNEKEHLIAQVNKSESSLVSIDENYSWDSFKEYVFEINELVTNNLNDLIAPDHIHCQLEYLNFFEFDYSRYDVTEFLQDYLKIKISNKLVRNTKRFKLTMSDKFDDGSLELNYMLGENSTGKNGVVVKFTYDSIKLSPKSDIINDWFESSHAICKSSFKSLIEGKLEDQIL